MNRVITKKNYEDIMTALNIIGEKSTEEWYPYDEGLLRVSEGSMGCNR